MLLLSFRCISDIWLWECLDVWCTVEEWSSLSWRFRIYLGTIFCMLQECCPPIMLLVYFKIFWQLPKCYDAQDLVIMWHLFLFYLRICVFGAYRFMRQGAVRILIWAHLSACHCLLVSAFYHESKHWNLCHLSAFIYFLLGARVIAVTNVENKRKMARNLQNNKTWHGQR